MRKTVAWILVGILLLGMVYALAESGTVAAQAPAKVLSSGEGKTGEGATPSVSPTASKNVYRLLKKGDSGDDVKALQSRLIELGFYYGKISGNYLDGSFYAISDFQKKNSLPVTGEADIKTQEVLFSASALDKSGKAMVTPSPTAVPTPAPMPSPVNSPTSNVQATPTPSPETIAFTKRLSKGSAGEKVKQLQERLFELGYYIGDITGSYDSETKAAIIEFQKNNSLGADGVTGEKTWNMLFNISDVLNSSATPRPTPAPTPVPYAITVDVTNQVITVYGLDENNQYTKVVRQMICSTGTRATPSDIGSWKLNSGRSKFPLFPKYGVYVQYWVPIANGIGFHSVIYNTQNKMDLAVGSYNQLGTRASHGCIRLLVDDAKWIYENAGKGTLVTITNKLPSDPELTQSLKPAALNRKNMLPKVTPTPTMPPVYDNTQTPPMPFRSLNRGDKGEDVYWLQMKLKEMGYYTGTVTGGYYGGTQKAVKAYQKAMGLSADGVAGIKTQNMLYADVLPTTTPEAGPVPTPTSTAKP